MDFQLFSFLEDNAKEVVSRAEAQIRRSRKRNGAPILASRFTALLTRLYDGYVDLMVTGQSAIIDRVSRALLRVLPQHGLRFSDVFAVPLTMSSVIRQMLFERQQAEAFSLEVLGKAVDQVELQAHQAASRFLDALQDHFDTLVKEHNTYLKSVAERLETEISPLPLARPAYSRS